MGQDRRPQVAGAPILRRATLLALTLPAIACCPHGGREAPPDALTEADDVLALMTGRLEPLESAAIVARASYYGDDGARKGKTILLLRRPAAVRFDALTPTDDMIAVHASDGERFTSFERGADVCYVGRSCPENVGRMLPITMQGADVITVLLGGAPLIRHHRRELAWDARVGAYRVTLSGDGDARQRIWIEHGTGLVKKTDLVRGGQIELDVTYEDTETVAGHLLPHTLRFQMRRGDVDLKLSYREVDLNIALADDAFAIACPEGTTVKTLPCPDDPLQLPPSATD